MKYYGSLEYERNYYCAGIGSPEPASNRGGRAGSGSSSGDRIALGVDYLASVENNVPSDVITTSVGMAVDEAP